MFTFWLGMDLHFGRGTRPTIFQTHIRAFEACPYADWIHQCDTEELALDVHDRVVAWVKLGLRPWWYPEDSGGIGGCSADSAKQSYPRLD